MDLWEATKILFRRWYVTVPIVLFALVGAYALGSQMDPEYIASGVGILLPIDEQGGEAAIFTVEEEDSNPWESAGAVATLRSVALVLVADDVRGQIVDQGLAPTYSIEVEPKDPILYIDVTDRNPDLALATLDEMILRYEDELDARQSQVQAPESRRYRVEILSQSEVPLPDYSNRSRVRIMVVLLGVVLAAAAGLVFDAWAVARKERRAKANSDAEPADETADEPPVLVAAPDALVGGEDSFEDDLIHQDGLLDEDDFSTGPDDEEAVRAPVSVGASGGRLRSDQGSTPGSGVGDAEPGRRTSGTSKGL